MKTKREAYLLDVSLGEVEDEVADAGDGDERAGAGAPELRVQRIPCRNRGRRHQHEAPRGGDGEHERGEKKAGRRS
jgi:hypothetical protein